LYFFQNSNPARPTVNRIVNCEQGVTNEIVGSGLFVLDFEIRETEASLPVRSNVEIWKIEGSDLFVLKVEIWKIEGKD
jgi:hypothetical protein